MNKTLFFAAVALPVLLSAQTYEELIATPDLSFPPKGQAQRPPQEYPPAAYAPPASPPLQNIEAPVNAAPLVQTREVTIEQPIYIDQIVEITNYITNTVVEEPLIQNNLTTVNVTNTIIRNVYTTQPLSPDIYTAVFNGRLNDTRIFIERKIYGPNAVYNDGNSLMHLAVYRPELLPIAIYLAEQGADLNRTNRLSQTPLHIAVLRSNLPAVELLIGRRASVSIKDAVGQTPLWLANIMGQLDILKLLAAAYQSQNPEAPLPSNIKAKGLPNVPSVFDIFNNRNRTLSQRPLENSPWHLNLYKPGMQGVAGLLSRGYDPRDADAKGQNALHIAALYDNSEAVQYLLNQGVPVQSKDKFGETALHLAAGRSSPGLIKLLVDYGASVTEKNNQGWTPLYEAALLGNLQALEYFLQQGVSPNTRTVAGRTPLHEAVRSGNNDMVIALLDKGAVLHSADKDGKTPLYLAAEVGNIQSAAQLISRGAPVDLETIEGLTPIHIAVRNGYSSLVQYLMEVGNADIFIPDSKGRYPLETAYARGDDGLIAYLAGQYVAAQAKAGTVAAPVILPAQNIPATTNAPTATAAAAPPAPAIPPQALPNDNTYPEEDYPMDEYDYPEGEE